MDKIYKAKEIYNSTPIPPELETVVKDAIEQGSARKAKKLSITKTLVPVAACAVICLVAGLGGVLNEFAPPEQLPQLAEEPMADFSAYNVKSKAMPAESVPEKLLPDAEMKLPFEESLKMYYSSGVGAWGTDLTLNNDGSFSGYFRDANAGEIGEGYPNGTVYECYFNGIFSEITKLDDLTYSMKLASLNVEGDGAEYVLDGVRYIAAKPYGLTGGEDFLFYLPQKQISALTDDQRFFWHGDLWLEGRVPDVISCYALINVNEDLGFFTEFSE